MARRNGLVCLLIHRQYKVRDATGKVWWFEMHPHCGPSVLDKKDGDPIWPPPPEDSPFWDAFGKWQDKHRPAPDPRVPQLDIKPEKRSR